jgi:hypothetical protein
MGCRVELVHGGHDAVLELLFGCDADMAQHRVEAAGRLLGEPSPGLLGDVRRMDQLDRRMARIGGVEELEEFNEFAAAVAVLDERVDLSGMRSMPASKLTAPSRLYS